MKKIVILLMSLLLCLTVFTACGDKDDFVPAGFKRISEDEATYRLFVPDSWVSDLSTGITTAYVSESDRSNISFMAFELDDSIFHVEVGGAEATTDAVTTDVVTTDAVTTDATTTEAPAGDGEVPKISTVEEYWDYYEAEFLKTFADMTYSVEGDDLLLSGQKAKKYVYTTTVTGQSYEFMQVVTIKAGTVYIFTYTALEEQFDAHLDDVNEILGYVEIK